MIAPSAADDKGDIFYTTIFAFLTPKFLLFFTPIFF